MCDIWRIKNPDEKQYSWYKCRPKLIASRIDFALISKGMIGECENICYTTGLQMDHLAVFLAFRFVENIKGPGYWKLNTQLLRNKEYVQMINSLIDKTLNETKSKSLKEAWEY